MKNLILRDTFNFNAVAENVLSLIRLLVGAKTFFIAYTDQEVFTILKSHSTDAEAANLLAPGMTMPLADSYCCAMFLGGREPLLIPDTSVHPLTKDLAITQEACIRSYLGVPILLQDGAMFGTLCALDSEPYRFNETEIDAMVQVSQFLSHALDLESVASSFRLKSQALDSAVNAVAISDADGDVIWVNTAFSRLTGYTLAELQLNHLKLLDVCLRQPELTPLIRQSISRGNSWQGETSNRHKDSSSFHTEMTITPVFNHQHEVSHFISIQQDITERKQTEKKLNFLAHYDSLTQLPNRVLFRETLNDKLSTAKRNHQAIALLFLNLDRFKNVNETLGHHVGDLLLKEAAKRIKDCVREYDIVSRISGDEFTVILTNVGSLYDAEKVAERLTECIALPMHVDGHELFVTASLGISATFLREVDSETLVMEADIAMHQAKTHDRGGYRFYSVEMSTSGRLDLENSLRRALDRDEFEVYYQPKVDLGTGHVIGMEALLRWIHPTLGTISPGVFIPLAEDIGLIGPIGEWVLRTACEQAKSWQDMGLPPIIIAVNLSVRQFQYGSIVDKVRAALEETGLDAQYLELEITESIIIQDTEKVISTLLALQEMGVGIAIDDFGTGYSSLSYLQKLPIHALKIDRSFVMDIKNEGDDTAIAKAVIALAHSLRLRVIAEGVETDAQLQFLRSQKCDAMQGYLFSRPLPKADMEEMLRQGKSLPLEPEDWLMPHL
jgi:diguanylate cyclase (GGDEF)-like protein/PAS domain S-box-containing protein